MLSLGWRGLCSCGRFLFAQCTVEILAVAKSCGVMGPSRVKFGGGEEFWIANDLHHDQITSPSSRSYLKGLISFQINAKFIHMGTYGQYACMYIVMGVHSYIEKKK